MSQRRVTANMRAWMAWPLMPVGRCKITYDPERNLVDFYACTGSYDADELIDALGRVLNGEGAKAMHKVNGVSIANPDAITIKSDTWRGISLDFQDDWTLCLQPRLGGRYVKLLSEVGDYTYRTSKLRTVIITLQLVAVKHHRHLRVVEME